MDTVEMVEAAMRKLDRVISAMDGPWRQSSFEIRMIATLKATHSDLCESIGLRRKYSGEDETEQL